MINKTSVFLVEYAEAGRFFIRFAERIREESNIVFITFLPSVYFLAKSLGFSVELVGKAGAGVVSEDGQALKTKAVALGGMSEKKAEGYVHKILVKLNRAIGKDQSVDVFVWNGASVSGVAARRYKLSRPENTGLLFFEIANLPGKCFVDCRGANAASFLYENPDFLGEYCVDEVEYSKWRSKYIESRMEAGFSPPQAKRKKVSFWGVIDFLYSCAIGAALFGPARKKIGNYLSKKKNNLHFSLAPKSGYVFLPLQVSTDSQIVLNSDIDNVGAIDAVLDQTDKIVVIKPHPAERDTDYLESVTKANPRVVLSNENTFSLLSSADEVYTINSTVGLESLILGKKTTFLGRSYFANFSKEDIPRYVLGHLIDIDFFSSDPVSREECLKAFSIVRKEERYVS